MKAAWSERWLHETGIRMIQMRTPRFAGPTPQTMPHVVRVKPLTRLGEQQPEGRCVCFFDYRTRTCDVCDVCNVCNVCNVRKPRKSRA